MELTREMADERIIEEFVKWLQVEPTEKEVILIDSDEYAQMGFYAGFRTAERLAKIEVLEELIKDTRNMCAGEINSFIISMLEEIKEGK